MWRILFIIYRYNHFFTEFQLLLSETKQKQCWWSKTFNTILMMMMNNSHLTFFAITKSVPLSYEISVLFLCPVFGFFLSHLNDVCCPRSSSSSSSSLMTNNHKLNRKKTNSTLNLKICNLQVWFIFIAFNQSNFFLQSFIFVLFCFLFF